MIVQSATHTKRYDINKNVIFLNKKYSHISEKLSIAIDRSSHPVDFKIQIY